MTTVMKKMSAVEEQAIAAKKAAKSMGLLSAKEKNEALYLMAEALEMNQQFILDANQQDLQEGKNKGYEQAFMDRLALTAERIYEFADGLRTVAELPDPIRDVLSSWKLENGLKVEEVRVPLGVIGMIYEARPNVTVDAAGLALKSGNAIILKGGSSAIHSNKAIVKVLRKAISKTKVPLEAVQFIESTDRDTAKQLFTMKNFIDVLIPRGGASLIQTVVEQATVPVLETGVGNCHIYVDKEADVNKALDIIVNAKTDRPAVCNAVETIIVHCEWLERHKEQLADAAKKAGIILHGDREAIEALPNVLPANEEDWANEYLSLDLAIKTVKNVDEAIEHIEKYGTKHSEAIITEDKMTARKFTALVDAAALYHNASTRFTDGGALGFGAEIGISTQKLHARGPMGLPALTTTKYIMTGNGQIR
ncbi:glutamate-5-semialdehyde dehydrogenase [Bacillus massiliglaciei]|uniref:glutamate-5-semialdehyde dehydrogenase n=1 Tax=Bacillus massiliglaciei TaxID=1816693 RepID=UPI000AFC2DBD|nr:glutamate-5-semialdehyde dehydrogenase [Bacillus massiliglaciei]